MAQTSVDMISAISEKRQVVLVIDELGKYLEDAAKNARDIFILQQLAELANRSEGKFIFLGILHQSFSQYTLKFDKEIKDEWQKIQGRFIDIPINITIAEQLSLISLCMDNQICWVNSDPKKHIQNFIKQIKAKKSGSTNYF